jgi:hypothetical protein
MIQASQNCGDLNSYNPAGIPGIAFRSSSGGGSPCQRAWGGMLAYAVAVGTTSTAVCAVCMLMTKFKPGSLVAVEVYIAFFAPCSLVVARSWHFNI